MQPAVLSGAGSIPKWRRVGFGIDVAAAVLQLGAAAFWGYQLVEGGTPTHECPKSLPPRPFTLVQPHTTLMKTPSQHPASRRTDIWNSRNQIMQTNIITLFRIHLRPLGKAGFTNRRERTPFSAKNVVTKWGVYCASCAARPPGKKMVESNAVLLWSP